MTDQQHSAMRVPEVVTSIPVPEALVKAMFESIRRVEDGQTRHQQLLMDARERLIRMENTDHSAQIIALNDTIESLESRIQLLEDERRERMGMGKLLDAVVKFGPWLLAVLGMIVAFMVGERKV